MYPQEMITLPAVTQLSRHKIQLKELKPHLDS